MNDKELNALEALAQRIEDADEQPITIGKAAARAIRSLISSVEQKAARIAEMETFCDEQGNRITNLRLQEAEASRCRAQGGNTCWICGENEPRTGACGSSDPRALCNLATPARDVGGLTDA